VPRVVLDTNVLVSALITPRGPSARLLVELRAGAFELLTSPLLLAELHEVLLREKFVTYVAPEDVAAYVELIRSMAIEREDPGRTDLKTPDPDDDFVVAFAVHARADAIVSGDAHLLEWRGPIPVLSPAEFLRSIAE
jgi:putative PIN family toxin of toxin-antitoxin system